MIAKNLSSRTLIFYLVFIEIEMINRYLVLFSLSYLRLTVRRITKKLKTIEIIVKFDFYNVIYSLWLNLLSYQNDCFYRGCFSGANVFKTNN